MTSASWVGCSRRPNRALFFDRRPALLLHGGADMRLLLVASLLCFGCAAKQSSPDGQAQDAPQDACTFPVYTQPGCGAAAVPRLIACDTPDSGSIRTVCTCDGETKVVASEGAPMPFASFGACDGGTGDGAADACATGGECFSGYPRCTFVEPPAGGSTQCSLADCTVIVDAGADAGPYGCGACADGYGCAYLCPSPLGGCGPPVMCCRTH